MKNNKEIKVGVEEKDSCFFGTLSYSIYNGANGIVVRYIDFPISKNIPKDILNFKACLQEELIYINTTTP